MRKIFYSDLDITEFSKRYFVAKCGISHLEFLNENNCDKVLEKWWNNLTVSKQYGILIEYRNKLSSEREIIQLEILEMKK